jgi:nucleoid-associated protein YgaU
VKEGDSLWQIASEQLGDGNRYKEIVKLNSDILSSEDDIQVDMKLKLPAK